MNNTRIYFLPMRGTYRDTPENAKRVSFDWVPVKIGTITVYTLESYRQWLIDAMADLRDRRPYQRLCELAR